MLKIQYKEVERMIRILSSELKGLRHRMERMALNEFDDETIGGVIMDLMLEHYYDDIYFYDALEAFLNDNYEIQNKNEVIDKEDKEEILKTFNHIKTDEDFNEIKDDLDALIESCKENEEYDEVYFNERILSYVEGYYKKAIEKGLEFYVSNYYYGICAIYDRKNDKLEKFMIEY